MNLALPFLLLILNILVFLVSAGLLWVAWPKRYLAAVRWLILLIVCFCVVSIGTLGVYISSDFEAQVHFSRFRFLGFGLIGPAWFLFIAACFNQSQDILNKKWILGLIVLPGIVTSVLTFIPIGNEYLQFGFQPILLYGFNVLQFKSGFWFQVHYFWTLLTLIAATGFAVHVGFRQKGVLRNQSIVLIFFAVLAASIDIYCVIADSPLRWLMVSSGTFSLCLLGVWYSMNRLHLFDLTGFAAYRVFELLPDPIVVLDQNQRIRSFNPSAKNAFDLNEKLRGERAESVFQGSPFEPGELKWTHSNGQTSFFHLVNEPILDHRGEQNFGQILYFRRIDFQKSVEERLEANLEFKERVLALVAHDLSGHIEAQRMLADSLDRELNAPDLIPRTRLLRTSTQASQNFIQSILYWVKSQQPGFKPIRKDFEWCALIQDCIDWLQAFASIKGVHIRFQADQRPLIAKGDSEMLMSVVRNLMTNSIQASEMGQSVNMRLTVDQGFVQLQVMDQGKGMSKEQLLAVQSAPGDFNLNFQVSSSEKNSDSKIGIGVRIIKHFVALHQGVFQIQSQLGQGTVVTVRIPLF